ncbi:MAG: hypothetical protein WCC81_06330 [Pseudolabrys sp.]|jgi:phosphate/sulfate permease
MEIVFWVIVAIVALVIAYICALSVAKRRYRSDRSAAAPDPKEHGVDLQARRKLHDDVT